MPRRSSGPRSATCEAGRRNCRRSRYANEVRPSRDDPVRPVPPQGRDEEAERVPRTRRRADCRQLTKRRRTGGATIWDDAEASIEKPPDSLLRGLAADHSPSQEKLSQRARRSDRGFGVPAFGGDEQLQISR